MSQKSYDDSPTLYLIPTPIGNMEDITIRALNTLKEVDVVFCEDTRVTGQLLKYFDMKRPLEQNNQLGKSIQIIYNNWTLLQKSLLQRLK